MQTDRQANSPRRGLSALASAAAVFVGLLLAIPTLGLSLVLVLWAMKKTANGPATKES